MILTFRPIDKWPDNWDRASNGKPSPFRGTYQSTLEILDREVYHLEASDVYLQIDIDPSKIKMDGSPRADAHANYRGCILVIDTPKFGVLTYATDVFEAPSWRSGEAWHANLRAIALALESLRQIERYGVANRGEQYAGFAQLGSGIPMGRAKMTKDEAWKILTEGAGASYATARSPDNVQGIFHLAAEKHHPDKGGDGKVMAALTEARDVMVAP